MHALSDVGSDRRSSFLFGFLLVVNTLIVLVPILTVDYPGLSDYPNHLARCYIIRHYDDVRIFHKTYLLLHEPVPNIACDLTIPVLMRFFDPFVAGKLFLSFCVFLFSFGIYLISATSTKSGSWLASLLPFTFFCSQLFWGLINYMFGVSLFLVGFGLWLRWRHSWNAWKLCCMILLATALYLSHLSAFVLMGVAAVTVLAVDALDSKRLPLRVWLSLLPMLPGLVLFVYYLSASRSSGSWIDPYWPSIGEKAVSALSPFIAYDYWLDGIGIGILALAGCFFLIRYKEQTATRPLLVTSIVLFVLFLACPPGLFGGWGADVRFVTPAVILFVLSLHVRGPKRVARLLFLIELSVLIVRVSFIEARWLQSSNEIAADVNLMMRIPNQSSLTPIYDKDYVLAGKQSRLFCTITSYAVVLRDVYDLKTYESPGRLVLRKPQTGPGVGLYATASQPTWDSLFNSIEYFWAYKPNPKLRSELVSHCTLIGTAPNSELWVRKDPTP
jgi:hypothetical protein